MRQDVKAVSAMNGIDWYRGLAKVAAVLLCAMMPAKAGGALDGHALNTVPWSWGVWGNAVVTELKDSAVSGGTFKRVAIAQAPEHPWDIGIYITLQKPVKKGDVIVLALWARAQTLPKDNEFTPLKGRVFDTATSVSVVPESTLMVGKTWKRFIATGIADKDYPMGSLAGGITIGNDAQTLDFTQVVIADFPPGFDLAALPQD